MFRGDYADLSRMYSPFSQSKIIPKKYFKTDQHSETLKEINCSNFFKLISLTLMSLGIFFSKPMNPSLIISTPVMFPSMIHFCRLQLLAIYWVKIKPPWSFLLYWIHSPFVRVSINALIRHSSANFSPTLTPLMLAVVKISKSSSSILIFFSFQ